MTEWRETEIGRIPNDWDLKTIDEIKSIISNKQLRLRINSQIVEPLFAYYWFASPFVIDIILQRNTGSSVPLINLSVLKSLQIPIPTKSERDNIVKLE